MFVFPLAFRKSLMPALLAPLLLTWPARAAAGPDAERAPTADVVYYGGPIYPLTVDYLHPSTLVPARAHRGDVVAGVCGRARALSRPGRGRPVSGGSEQSARGANEQH